MDCAEGRARSLQTDFFTSAGLRGTATTAPGGSWGYIQPATIFGATFQRACGGPRP
jgi:hypothetical protein